MSEEAPYVKPASHTRQRDDPACVCPTCGAAMQEWKGIKLPCASCWVGTARRYVAVKWDGGKCTEHIFEPRQYLDLRFPKRRAYFWWTTTTRYTP